MRRATVAAAPGASLHLVRVTLSPAFDLVSQPRQGELDADETADAGRRKRRSQAEGDFGPTADGQIASRADSASAAAVALRGRADRARVVVQILDAAKRARESLLRLLLEVALNSDVKALHVSVGPGRTLPVTSVRRATQSEWHAAASAVQAAASAVHATASALRAGASAPRTG